jgi:hypothetical protein
LELCGDATKAASDERHRAYQNYPLTRNHNQHILGQAMAKTQAKAQPKARTRSRPKTDPIREGLHDLDAARTQQMAISTFIIAKAQAEQIPPGLVMLGVMEFVALMVHRNFPDARRPDEVERLATYLRNRVTELQETPPDATTH